MSASESTTTSSDSSSTESSQPSLCNIGIELEYPLSTESTRPAPAGQASGSGVVRDEMREEYGRGAGEWLGNRFDTGQKSGYVGSDHVGAEITSGILDLQSSEPEDWYNMSIERVEEAGHEFAATGYGRTVFGLHLHLSEMNEDQYDVIEDVAGTEWGRVFFCASIDENSLDPWRHGGVRSPSSPFSRDSRGSNHYEFRLQEPVQREHFPLVMDFLRMIADEELDEAKEFARELVYDKDERLTPIAQYNQLDEAIEDWPTTSALEGDSRTDEHVAGWFADLMQSSDTEDE